VILARIQAHPSRAHLHDRLIAALAPLEVDVMIHQSDPPDPWANYQRCLMGTTEDITHIVVVQDDCLPAPGFAEAVQQIAQRWPTTPVCLFMGALPAATASLARRAKPDVRYVPLVASSFVPLVCTMWPASVARDFLAWSTTGRGITRADDGNAARWMRATKQQFMVTVPSIVQHDDGQPSVKGGRDHVPWAEKWRQALLLADDAASYDWLA
jgi:hypothetical protein